MAPHASLATQASRDLDKVKKQKSDRLKAALVQAEDTLKPDAEEEAVHILIDDDFAFTTQDVVALVRLRQPTNTGLEEHVDIDELEADSSPLNSPLNSPARPGLTPRKKRGSHWLCHHSSCWACYLDYWRVLVLWSFSYWFGICCWCRDCCL